jgi:hypothetical protein
MVFKKFRLIISTLSVFTALSLSAVDAQQTASANLAGDGNDASDTAAVPKKANEKSSDNGFSTADFLPPEQRKNLPAEVDSKVPLKVVINVPRNIDARNEFTFYPYPMKPPPVKQQQKPLPETARNGLSNMLLSSGYSQRTQATLAYPFGGWRWQYAYNAALRRSGLGVPHVMTEMYAWVDDMMPYIKPEVIRLNLAEKERHQRYDRAREDFEETRVDIESDSVRKGLFPVPVRMQTYSGRVTRFGSARVLPGSWWLVGTHKVAGLTYYWNQPVEVDENQPKTIELTEANALLIEGGW